MTVQQHENSVEETQVQPHSPLLSSSTTLEQTEQEQTQPRYEQSEVERIIAQASALQDKHHRTLSQEQIESIAAEVGIRPEFVRLAMGDETIPVVSQQSQVVRHEAVVTAEPVSTAYLAAGIGAYGILATALLVSGHDALMFLIVFVIPFLLAIALGVMSQSRRRGAALGAALAVTVIVAAMMSASMSGYAPSQGISAADMRVFTLIIAVGTLLGAAGAEGRRIVSRRQVTDRTRRTEGPV